MADYLHHAVPVDISTDHSTIGSTGSNRRKKSSSSSSSKRSSTPKGILKNSNPNASYHKSQEPFEELVERERPRSTSSGHHRHHHRSSRSSDEHGHHKKRSSSKRSNSRDESNFEEEEDGVNSEVQEKNRKNHRHHHSGERKSKHHHRSSSEAGGTDRHKEESSGHAHSNERGSGKKHHSSSGSGSSSRRSKKGDQSDKHRSNGGSNSIYDQPKVPAMKYLHADDNGEGNEEEVRKEGNYSKEEVNRIYKAIVRAAEHTEKKQSQGFYENFEFGEGPQQPQANNQEGGGGEDAPIYDNDSVIRESEQVLYDVPRSNKKVVKEEAIYVNDGFGGRSLNGDEEQQDYDVPRTSQQKSLSDLVPQDYDVPKIRDSLSTIEEEHQEYDIPRTQNNQALLAKESSTEELYENQSNYSVPKSNYGKPSSSPVAVSGLYANERSYCDFVSGHSNDDRSSGYRSSSSPSIQSEELYVNEAVSMDDLDSCGSSHKHSSPEPSSNLQTRDIAIETTLERHTETRTKKKSSAPKDKTLAKELARERERERAEEIEREIRRKKEENNKFQKSSAIKQFFDNRSDTNSLDKKKDKAGGNYPVQNDSQSNKSKSSSSSVLAEFSSPGLRSSSSSSNVPKFDIPNDDFVTIGEIAGGVDSGEEEEAPVAAVKEVKVEQAQKSKKPTISYSFSPKPVSSSSRPTSAQSHNHLVEETKRQLRKNIEWKTPSPPSPPPAPPVAAPVAKVEEKTIEKKKERDRSVDVYHETVRQRASTRSETLSKDVFAKQPTSAASSSTAQRRKKDLPLKEFGKGKESTVKIKSFADHRNIAKQSPIAPLKPDDMESNDLSSQQKKTREPRKEAVKEAEEEEDMPSVRQLRSRFENGSSSPSQSPVRENVSSSPANASASPTKKSNFNVMCSLTRRGAMAMSKSLHNLNDQSKHEKKQIMFSSNETGRKQPGNNSTLRGSNGFEKKSTPALSSQSSKDSHRHHPHHHASDSATDGVHKMVATPELPIIDSNGKWSPMALVARMYILPELDDDEVAKNSADAAHIEDYLERLPQGKKKSTLWNGWKKQYFVADKGILTAYGDRSCDVPLERIEMFGGKAELLEDGEVVGLHDRRGHYLALRCPAGEGQAKRWHKAMKGHINQDFAKTFVTPSKLPKQLKMFTDVLVIDFGGSSVRAGVATTIPTLPQLFFPSVMAAEHTNEQAKYFGLDTFAPEVRSRSKLSHPMVPSHHVDKYSVDQIALQGILEKIFKELNLDPNHYQVQLSVPRTFSDRTKQAVASILFEEFGVKALNMAHQTVFSFYSYNARSGIMVDLGERMDVVPIVEGYKVQAGVSRSPVGGKELRSKLQHYLLGRNYSLTSFIDSFVTRYAVENLAYMSANFDRELDAYARDPEAIDQSVEVAPSGCMDAPVRKLEMGSERFEACEGLFKPELWGLDQAGVHVLVHKAIKECSMDVRKEVTQSIFLAGGLTLIPGFRDRLEAEVGKLTQVRPRVHASPYRYHAAYLGAMVHSNSEAFGQTKVTKQEWLASGAALDRYWTM